MGRSHFARLRDHPNALVVAVCDHDERRRAGDWNDALGNLDLVKTEAGRASLEGVRRYATPAELLADSEVDVVLIALPTAMHAEVAVAALRAGKHVFCEKPMALRPNDCNHMLDAARAAGRTLMIGQCLRFWPQYEAIRQRVVAGAIGTVRFAVLRRLGTVPTYSADQWLLDARQSGGALLDLHVHDVDFAHHLLGIPHTLYACGTRGASGDFDHVTATWTYADGRYVVLEGGWVSAAPWPFDMEIMVHGDGGTLGWAMSRGTEVILQPPDGPPQRIACAGDALHAELDYFIDCVRTGRPVERCLPASTRLSVVLAWLERRSVETARIVPISERLQSVWTV